MDDYEAYVNTLSPEVRHEIETINEIIVLAQRNSSSGGELVTLLANALVNAVRLFSVDKLNPGQAVERTVNVVMSCIDRSVDSETGELIIKRKALM